MFLLQRMASLLIRLPIYREDLLKDRTRVLEKIMLYVFTYIIYGISLAVIYVLINMITHDNGEWNSLYWSSFLLQLVWLPTNAEISSSIVFSRCAAS